MVSDLSKIVAHCMDGVARLDTVVRFFHAAWNRWERFFERK